MQKVKVKLSAKEKSVITICEAENIPQMLEIVMKSIESFGEIPQTIMVKLQ